MGTVGAGLINFSLRSHKIFIGTQITWMFINAQVSRNKPIVLWLTGLSGSGKSTIANEVERKLRSNRHTFLLDGDNLRHGLNKIWASKRLIVLKIFCTGGS